LIDKSLSFLENHIGRVQNAKKDFKYITVLSPLVNRMNCHRDLDENTAVDFPSATPDFFNDICNSSLASRLVGNHIVFTETDHGFINPISDKYNELIAENFNVKIWDNNSGYTGINVFNEYMTWAVYDLFIRENYPEEADSIVTQWQYQNATRGFFAQNLFARKVFELYSQRGNEHFETIYEPLLKWCKSVENKIALPVLVNTDSQNFVKTDFDNIQLTFSEEMNTGQSFTIQIAQHKSSDDTEKNEFVEIRNFEWTADRKTVQFKLDPEPGYDQFALIFNWWGNNRPLISSNGIFLRPQSVVLLSK
jgi:hypothetical protein